MDVWTCVKSIVNIKSKTNELGSGAKIDAPRIDFKFEWYKFNNSVVGRCCAHPTLKLALR